MAVKGLVAIDNYIMYEDHTFNVSCTLCDDLHHMTGLMSSVNFTTSSTSLEVNTAIHDAAVSYVTEVWGAQFNPLVDVIKIVNPVDMISL